MSLNEVHISSLVVHCSPEHLGEVKSQIEQYDNAEIYGDSPEGKIVVVLETENQGFITDTIETINNLPNVLSTALVYHQIETGLDDESQNNNTGTQYSQTEGEV
ncbi:chaperone NapD [Vibrio europaeus]|jgi:nitrate reductase NapD|uniref:Chaperone NapD n=3 Tax=Vibrio oreintalis group TaxID=1891919 RepID=F9TBY8_9VIBR|nr:MULTISPECIES: chaperone NapD [Vibrio oreintalis group]AIW16355.1 nitrate reductase [Vibrio tubiashii ATCC 19109]EGU48506.1 NapD protein, subunit of nitrate reductase [Vibrio tubiashii ATCC 19109]EIF02213.1 NapD protein subunit of nitrate reductase [Vibrio tubiashii NCIMB 1337 = ATCC 19106]MCG9580787.1 chaperone NapD [Vibrio tubiashii]MCG9614378.1 chaperone NapD [Vibrio tubiashii]